MFPECRITHSVRKVNMSALCSVPLESSPGSHRQLSPRTQALRSHLCWVKDAESHPKLKMSKIRCTVTVHLTLRHDWRLEIDSSWTSILIIL